MLQCLIRWNPPKRTCGVVVPRPFKIGNAQAHRHIYGRLHCQHYCHFIIWVQPVLPGSHSSEITRKRALFEGTHGGVFAGSGRLTPAGRLLCRLHEIMSCGSLQRYTGPQMLIPARRNPHLIPTLIQLKEILNSENLATLEPCFGLSDFPRVFEHNPQEKISTLVKS